MIEAIEGDLPVPAPAARAILLQFTDNLKLAACDPHPEVARALFSRPPVRIPAVFFGFLGAEVSFHREGPARSIGFRRADSLNLSMDRGSKTVPNFQHGGGQPWTEDEWIQVRFAPGDWAVYTFTLEVPATGLRVIAQARSVVGPGRLWCTVAGTVVELTLDRLGWDARIADFPGPLSPGTHSIRVESRDAAIDLEWLELSLKP